MKTITEESLKSLSSSKSFDRGMDLFQQGAVYDASNQGQQLSGKCIGSSERFYQQVVHLAEDGLSDAYCTCPYDWGGLCKHIIALVLTYIHDPDEFVDVAGIKAQLLELDQETLADILIQSVDSKSEGYDWLQKTIQDSIIISSPAKSPEGGSIKMSFYETRVNNILDYVEERYGPEDYWIMLDATMALEEIQEAACDFLEGNEAQTALEILTILFSEVAGRYGHFADLDDLWTDFLYSLAYPLVEAILISDLSEPEMSAYRQRLINPVKKLSLYGFEDLKIILYVMEADWAENPCRDFLEANPVARDILIKARLNIFVRRQGFEEYLAYSLEEGEYVLHSLMLIQLEKYSEAFQAAQNYLLKGYDILRVAEALKAVGQLREAIRLAEKGIRLEENDPQLHIWLGGIWEDQGQNDRAIKVYRAAFEIKPNYPLFKKLKALYGETWDGVKGLLIAALEVSVDSSVMLDVYLSEMEWDRAIQIANQAKNWQYPMIEKVADRVLSFRPEWVIQVSQEQADILIQKSSRKSYARAASWLAKAKQAYVVLGNEAAWETYLVGIKSTYHRRRALLSELEMLDHV